MAYVTRRQTLFILAGMDRNTMIVRLVEALLCFAALVVVVLRLDRLWLRLRKLQLDLGESVKFSASFFRQDGHVPTPISSTGGMAHLLAGDQLVIDRLIITHPDEDHHIIIAPHHGRRSQCA